MTKRTRIKICGITRLEDALRAIEHGADALGFVFYANSPRAITVEDAAAICEQLPAFITKVGLFVNEDALQVKATADQVGLNLLQFHGEETAEYCSQFNLPFMKALRVATAEDITAGVEQFSDSQSLLLDTFVADVQGGTGKTFDWNVIPAEIAHSIVLAGGLTPENVGKAVIQLQPYAVDVSGGVEAEPGKKSAKKISRFIAAVNHVDAELR